MTVETGGQMSLFDADTPFTKMSPERSPATEAKTGKPSSQKSRASSSQKLPIIRCLTIGNGNTQTGSLVWEQTGSPFPWLGAYTMHSTTVYRNGEKGYAYWLTSPDLQRLGYCLTLNLSERPRVENPSRLSEILETNTDPNR